jgi:multidrug efflux system membrane fusion protein
MPVSVLRDTRRGSGSPACPTRGDVIVVGQEFVTDGVPVKASYREIAQ